MGLTSLLSTLSPGGWRCHRIAPAEVRGPTSLWRTQQLSDKCQATRHVHRGKIWQAVEVLWGCCQDRPYSGSERLLASSRLKRARCALPSSACRNCRLARFFDGRLSAYLCSDTTRSTGERSIVSSTAAWSGSPRVPSCCLTCRFNIPPVARGREGGSTLEVCTPSGCLQGGCCWQRSGRASHRCHVEVASAAPQVASAACAAQDANMGHHLAGGNSS